MPFPETDSSPLPRRRVARLTNPVTRFLHIEAMSGVVLLVATIAALALANSPWAGPFLRFWETPVGLRLGSLEIVHSLRHAINDGLMTLFFFVVGLEIKREIVLGELRNLRVAALPVAAAVGGMLVPAAIFLALQAGTPGEPGWGQVMATDIAFVVGGLTLLGKRVPRGLRVFVLSLAIIDDIGAVLVITFGYPVHFSLLALGLGVLLIASILGLRYLGVRSVPIYFLAGMAAWLAVFESGVHPTIVGVVLGLLTPTHAWVVPQGFEAIVGRVGAFLRSNPSHSATVKPKERHALLRSVEFAARETLSPLERLEVALHPWVSFLIMPLFALANAGVPLTLAGFRDPLALAVIAGLTLGKPLGIVGASWIAERLGIARRPAELRWPLIAGAGILSGIGFTMSLFIASLAFAGPLLIPAKIGVFSASVVSAVAGLAVLHVVVRPRNAGRRA